MYECMYVYVYMYVCMYECMYVCMYMYIGWEDVPLAEEGRAEARFAGMAITLDIGVIKFLAYIHVDICA